MTTFGLSGGSEVKVLSSEVKVLRVKRSSRTADHFEKLVFVNGNMHLLKVKD
jgi:hypothetical protein